MEITFTPSGLTDALGTTDKSAELRSRNRPERDDDPSRALGGDTVKVSQDALLLTEARRTAQNAPDVRTEKVEELRIKVADGTYKPDSRLIASALLREEPGLFRP